MSAFSLSFAQKGREIEKRNRKLPAALREGEALHLILSPCLGGSRRQMLRLDRAIGAGRIAFRAEHVAAQALESFAVKDFSQRFSFTQKTERLFVPWATQNLILVAHHDLRERPIAERR